MRVLYDAGLVHVRKQGRHRYYRVREEMIELLVRSISARADLVPA
jgi:DNA-binding transcriptional ArsR family regulator